MDQKEFFSLAACMRCDIESAERIQAGTVSDRDLPWPYRATGHEYQPDQPISPPSDTLVVPPIQGIYTV